MSEDAVAGSMTAVVCEADESTRHLMSNMVREAGYEVVGEADRAFEAVELTRILTPSLVVIDQDLPFVTGLEVLTDLKDSSARCEVLLVTRDEGVRDEATSAGAFGVVYKTKLHELSGALARAKEFLEGSGERPDDERRTGRDRRQKQDWQQVTSERRKQSRRD
jgi:DNA-binding response OmpR family regulator